MATYRVYYAERESAETPATASERLARLGSSGEAGYKETEWEDEVQADSTVEALEAFFRNHAPGGRSSIHWLDDDGRSYSLGATDDYDPDRTYIWEENGRGMEFQGVDEATPGMVTCPLCNGHGEVDQDLAAEFHDVWDEEEEDEDEDGEDEEEDETHADIQG